MITAVIIDDINEARLTLKEDLQNYCPEISVIGEANGVVSGVKLLKNQKPEVVFLDIQMNDGSGFDLLELLGEIRFKVIFTTASDAHAIRAFRFSAVDYLLKPIDPDELVQAVKKLGDIPGNNREGIELLMDSIKIRKRPLEKLSLHTQDKIHIVNIRDIIRCESQVNYTQFYFTGGKKLLVTRTLKDFEELLKEHPFIRVHQSHLVNMGHLKEFVKADGGYLVMSDNAGVPVSTRKKSIVMEMLEKL
jgi:two-component system LytT family response regulator